MATATGLLLVLLGMGLGMALAMVLQWTAEAFERAPTRWTPDTVPASSSSTEDTELALWDQPPT